MRVMSLLIGVMWLSRDPHVMSCHQLQSRDVLSEIQLACPRKWYLFGWNHITAARCRVCITVLLFLIVASPSSPQGIGNTSPCARGPLPHEGWSQLLQLQLEEDATKCWWRGWDSPPPVDRKGATRHHTTRHHFPNTFSQSRDLPNVSNSWPWLTLSNATESIAPPGLGTEIPQPSALRRWTLSQVDTTPHGIKTHCWHVMVIVDVSGRTSLLLTPTNHRRLHSERMCTEVRAHMYKDHYIYSMHAYLQASLYMCIIIVMLYCLVLDKVYIRVTVDTSAWSSRTIAPRKAY